MRRISDSDFGAENFEGKCKEKTKYKLIVLDNSGSVALFGKEGEYKLPEIENKVDEVVIDNVTAELNNELTTIEEIKAKEKVKYNIVVYVAKVSVKDDINVKWVRPEEALKIVSVYKRNIEMEEYNRKFEILEDENALRDYIIKYIY